MLSITGIKTHYYKGTSIIQSSADIIQKSKRIMIYVQCTFDMNVHGMVCALVEESFTKHQVQKSTGKATRFKLERSVVWPTRVTRISVNSVSSSARNIIIFVWILTLFVPGKKTCSLLTLETLARLWWEKEAEPDRGSWGSSEKDIHQNTAHTCDFYPKASLWSNVLGPGAIVVLRGVPAEGRGDSGQKTDPGFGWGPAKRNTLITNFKENQRNLNYRCESTHRRREAWDGHGGERSDAVGGILVRGSSNVVGRLGEVG